MDSEGGEDSTGFSTTAATVRLKSTNSILVLEEIEHLLSSIECTSSTIQISTFESTNTHMLDQLHTLSGGSIITSHATCNNASTRQAYKVLSTTQIESSTISFSVTAVSWKDKSTFTHLSVSLDHTPTQSYPLRSHAATTATAKLEKRQIAYDSTNFSFAIAPTISSYGPLPSSPPQQNSHSFDLSTLGPFMNTQYPLHLPGTSNPAPVAVGCANCTLRGVLDVAFANFDVDLGEESISGEVTLQAQGVGAHLWLAVNVTDTWYFTFPLASKSYALEIAGFGEVAFGVGEFVAGGYEMQGNVGMRFGFDMTVSCLRTVISVESS